MTPAPHLPFPIDPGLPVDTVMTRAVTVPSGVGIRAALVELSEAGGEEIIVVDDSLRPVGVFAGERIAAEWCPERVGRGSSPGEEADPDGWPLPAPTPSRVDELMVPVRARLAAGASIAEACALMASSGCSRAAVIGEKGRLVGVVTAGSVLFWVARAVAIGREPRAGRSPPRRGA